MKYIINSEVLEIEVGDLIKYEGEICIVAYIPNAYVDDTFKQETITHPYRIISLDTGKDLNSVSTLEYLNRNHTRFKPLSKNKDVTLEIGVKKEE